VFFYAIADEHIERHFKVIAGVLVKEHHHNLQMVE
jgi:hypothetical protein